MVQSLPMTGGPLVYRSGQELRPPERAVALGLVVALHGAVIGGFTIAALNTAPPPPEQTITVSLISETPAAAAAPSPPQPAPPAPPTPQVRTPPPPEPRLMATPTPTLSPMTAPPMEKVPEAAAQPAPAAPPAPAVSAAAPSSDSSAATAVTPPNFTAAYLNNPGPAYPYASRRKREQGVVRMRVQVSAEGAPNQVLLERSSGFGELDAAAMDVVKKRWRFAPAKQGDRAVSAWVIVPMEFSLKDR